MAVLRQALEPSPLERAVRPEHPLDVRELIVQRRTVEPTLQRSAWLQASDIKEMYGIDEALEAAFISSRYRPRRSSIRCKCAFNLARVKLRSMLFTTLMRVPSKAINSRPHRLSSRHNPTNC